MSILKMCRCNYWIAFFIL
ncbi:hypothetical protein KGM_212603A, partial [Danaus plexippus plexippus]